MKKQLSDEQLDQLMRTLVSDATLDDTAIDEIADSPAIWWSVQREINLQKELRSPWPPVLKRWLMIGVPAFAALALVSIFVFRPTGDSTEQAGMQQNVATVTVESPAPAVIEPADPAESIPTTDVAELDKKVKRSERQARSARVNVQRKRNTTTPSPRVAAEKTEIKTDFIALSYARYPESGQVVRVKVPSSMMVTLGLVASVEKPTNLVDAEVVIGDDGMTHAIRFIR